MRIISVFFYFTFLLSASAPQVLYLSCFGQNIIEIPMWPSAKKSNSPKLHFLIKLNVRQYCSAAEMSWLTNPVFLMQENIFVWYRTEPNECHITTILIASFTRNENSDA